MRPPRRAVFVLAATLLAAPALAGCFGDVKAVYLPASVLPEDWAHSTDNETQEAAKGMVEIVYNQYKYDDRLVAEIYLVAVTDVPFVDEHKEVEKRIKDYADDAGVTLTKTGSRDITLDNGKDASVTEYSIEKQRKDTTVRGEAWLVKWETKDFVGAGLGFATTEYESALGLAEDDTQWLLVQDLMHAADW